MAFIRGYSNILRNLKTIKKKIPKVYTAAMQDITLRTKGEAQKITPVDTGVLRSSAQSGILGKATQQGVRGYVTYTAAYALIVHESVWLKHKPPTSAKFLSIGVDKIAPKAQEIYAYYLRKLT